jgi:hypothetical protein
VAATATRSSPRSSRSTTRTCTLPGGASDDAGGGPGRALGTVE